MHHVAEVRLAAVVVGQRAVVHDLQQDVEDVRMRLLDLVEQQHAVRLLGDLLGEQAALVETDVARGRADQAADCVAVPCIPDMSKRTSSMPSVWRAGGRPRSSDAGGAGEQEEPIGFCGLPSPGATS